MHKLTLLIGIVAIVLYIIGEINGRKTKQAYDFEVLSSNIFILKLVFVSLLIGGMTWVLSGFNGFSWTVVVMLIVVGIYSFVTNRTVLGRHIYAVGGNPEAAELSGVDVKRITYVIFGQMGMLAALSGMMFASRLQSATTTAGTLFELDAIAAAFVGGVSAAGGVGKVTGALDWGAGNGFTDQRDEPDGDRDFLSSIWCAVRFWPQQLSLMWQPEIGKTA